MKVYVIPQFKCSECGALLFDIVEWSEGGKRRVKVGHAQYLGLIGGPESLCPQRKETFLIDPKAIEEDL